MKTDMTAAEHLQQCAACNHGRTPCQEYVKAWPVQPNSVCTICGGVFKLLRHDRLWPLWEHDFVEPVAEPAEPSASLQQIYDEVEEASIQPVSAEPTAEGPRCPCPCHRGEHVICTYGGGFECDMSESLRPFITPACTGEANGFVQHPVEGNPSCHVCGNPMHVVRATHPNFYYGCNHCGTTTAPTSVPQAPERNLSLEFQDELDAKLHKALNPGVPQAEPPKKESK